MHDTRIKALGRALSLLLATSLGACGGARSSEPPLLAPSALVLLGPGDVFDVRVFGEQDLSGTYRVASDGTINFPLVGKLNIGGMAASAVGDLIEIELGRYLRSPNVSVFVKEYNSKKIYVFGEVTKPGNFPYEDGMNIIQAITLAGGFGRIADKNGTFVARVIEGREQRLKVPVKEIGEGEAPNFKLEPGDIVFVPESVF
jgi:protein involved in polysaccharide export with SLBB domain